MDKLVNPFIWSIFAGGITYICMRYYYTYLKYYQSSNKKNRKFKHNYYTILVPVLVACISWIIVYCINEDNIAECDNEIKHTEGADSNNSFRIAKPGLNIPDIDDQLPEVFINTL